MSDKVDRDRASDAIHHLKDRIAELEAENKRLREALEAVVSEASDQSIDGAWYVKQSMETIAKHALGGAE